MVLHPKGITEQPWFKIAQIVGGPIIMACLGLAGATLGVWLIDPLKKVQGEHQAIMSAAAKVTEAVAVTRSDVLIVREKFNNHIVLDDKREADTRRETNNLREDLKVLTSEVSKLTANMAALAARRNGGDSKF